MAIEIGNWQARLDEIRSDALDKLAAAASEPELEEVRVAVLGRKGSLTGILRGIPELPKGERPVVGQAANRVRAEIEAALANAADRIGRAAQEARLAEERIDITLPGVPPARGHEHPLHTVVREIEDAFLSMGFELAQGPQIETEELNFELLNMPADHPARDMQDSFFIRPGIVLRTHTSPMQIRYMRAQAPQLPVRMVTLGRVFRRDDDATHSPMFTQCEGLLVDRGIHFGHLKWTLEELAHRLFGDRVRTRLRPSYFPFTEPSAELDISCTICGGEGCRTCSGSGWLEILGSGMVHPQVLRNGGYDPDEVSGFAFGMGPDRIAMLKYGIPDLRLMFQNDLRFLEQF